jgi:hypothetical protein
MILIDQSVLTGETIEVTVIPYSKKQTSCTQSKTCVTHTETTGFPSLDRTLNSILTLFGLKIGSVFLSPTILFSNTIPYTLNFRIPWDSLHPSTQPILSIKTKLNLGKREAISTIFGDTMGRIRVLLSGAGKE